LDVIGMAAFSTDLKAMEGSRNEYQNSLYKLLDLMIYLSRKPFSRFLEPSKWKEMRQANISLNAINRELVQKRKSEINSSEFNDFLQILLEEDELGGRKFSENDVNIDIKDLLAAGHETTSNSLCFSLYLLAKNPDIQKRVQEETDTFPSEPSYDDTSKMKLVNAVIKEALRIYPVIPQLGRFTNADTKLKFSDQREVFLPKNSKVFFSIHSLGRYPRNFPNPDKFDIDRWTEHEEGGSSAWIPFGTGARSCVGQRMALVESKIILCMILQNYTIGLTNQAPLEIVTALTQRPQTLKLLLQPRK